MYWPDHNRGRDSFGLSGIKKTAQTLISVRKSISSTRKFRYLQRGHYTAFGFPYPEEHYDIDTMTPNRRTSSEETSSNRHMSSTSIGSVDSQERFVV
jgi:hypothetical protein